MKHILFIVTLGVMLLASHANAAIIIDRHSQIVGNGIGVPTQTTDSTDLFADFNETLSAFGQPGYVEQYTISQHSTVGVNGFSLQTSSSGSVTSGNFAGVATQTFFQLDFYVTELSLITISVDYSHPLGGGDGGVGFLFKSVSRTGNQINGNLETYFSYGSGQVPGSFIFSTTLEPVMHFLAAAG